MVNLETLDTLIALVVILLVLSLSVQSIQAAIKKFFRIKSHQIEQSLIHLFYYSLNKDARVMTRGLIGRMPVLRSWLSRGSADNAIPAKDADVQAIFMAVKEEFRRAGRITYRDKVSLDSISKDDLLKFLGSVPAGTLLKHIAGDKVDEVAGLKQKVADASQALERLFRDHRDVIAATPFAKIELPLQRLLNNANMFLAAGSASFTLGELAKFSAAQISEARVLLASLPQLITESLQQLEKMAQPEGAALLREFRERLKPLYDNFDAIVALPMRLTQIHERIETWYDTIMQSFEERYARSMKSYAIAISLIVVVLLNANLFKIYRQISTNDAQRNLIIAASDDIRRELQRKETSDAGALDLTLEEWKKRSFNEISKDISTYTALGFEGPSWLKDLPHRVENTSLLKKLEVLSGWLLMTLLLSVGAPFWQDTLESLFGLKNFLRKQGKEGK